MKKLIDYKGTNTLIEIHNNEEYKKMVPLLNEVFNDWKSEKEYFKNGGYVDMYSDMAFSYSECKHKIDTYKKFQASEFLDQQENNITIEKLQKGEIYFTEWCHTSNNPFIFKNELPGKAIRIADNLFKQSTSLYTEHAFKDLGKLRLANKEEKEWFLICERENKFIPKDQIANYSPITTKKEEIMKEKWKVGGWVKITKNNTYFNQIHQILRIRVGEWGKNDNKLLVLKDINYQPWAVYEGKDNYQCEWIGMNKPEIPFINNTKQPKFEVGKWYKIKLYENSYFKFEGLGNYGSYNTIHCVDRIWKGNYVSSNTISNSEAENSSVLLTDLSEIQSFLPEGHIDKIVKELPKEKENLLEKAKKLYPVGTKFRSPFNNAEYTVTQNNHLYTIGNGEYIITVSTDKGNGSILPNGASVWSERSGWGEIIKQEEIVPEYVECIKYASTDNEYIVGKIYKVENRKVRTEQGYLGMQELPKSLLNHYQNTDFKISTFGEFSAQESLKQWKEYPLTTKECINTYSIGIDPYQNQEIGLGDEVEVIKHLKFNNDSSDYSKTYLKIGKIYKTTTNSINYSHTGELGIKVEGGENYTFPIGCFKLIGKANTITTTQNKQVDSPLPKNKAITTTLLSLDEDELLLDTSVNYVKSSKKELILEEF